MAGTTAPLLVVLRSAEEIPVTARLVEVALFAMSAVVEAKPET